MFSHLISVTVDRESASTWYWTRPRCRCCYCCCYSYWSMIACQDTISIRHHTPQSCHTFACYSTKMTSISVQWSDGLDSLWHYSNAVVSLGVSTDSQHRYWLESELERKDPFDEVIRSSNINQESEYHAFNDLSVSKINEDLRRECLTEGSEWRNYLIKRTDHQISTG